MRSFYYFVLVAIATSLLVRPAAAQQTSYDRGEKVVLPAPVGIDDQAIGMGYPLDLSRLDATRVIDNEVRTVSESSYRALFRKQTNTFELNASASALGLINASASTSTQKRHAVLTVYSVSDVARLAASPAQAKGANADLFVSKIYYGWALNVVIEGSSTSFTTGVASSLQDMVGAGGSIEAVMEENNLRSEVILRGLESKSGTPPVALTWQAVQRQFEIGDPQPILVEYTFLRDVSPTPIKWKDRTLTPGEYRLTEVSASVSRSKGNGRDWDFASGPDAVIEIYANGRRLVSVGPERNAFTVTHTPNRLVDLRPNTALQFNVYDEDATRGTSDRIGTAEIRYSDLRQRDPGEPIDLRPTGQLKNLQIVLAPAQ
jgi:hypothetical protein